MISKMDVTKKILSWFALWLLLINSMILPWVFAEDDEEIENTTIVGVIQNQLEKSVESMEDVEEL